MQYLLSFTEFSSSKRLRAEVTSQESRYDSKDEELSHFFSSIDEDTPALLYFRDHSAKLKHKYQKWYEKLS